MAMLKDKFYSDELRNEGPSPPSPPKKAFRTFCCQFCQQKSDVHLTACLFDEMRAYESSQTIYYWVIGDVTWKVSKCGAGEGWKRSVGLIV